MDNVERVKLQASQILLLHEADKICKKYDLVYYLIGGTLLGAARHHGFIPWDIDIDIAMMRCDYERFIDCCKTDLTENFFLQHYKTEKEYWPPHMRLCINGTEIRYRNEQDLNLKYNRGIYIDIFPLDCAPLTEKEQNRQRDIVKFYNKLKTFKLLRSSRDSFLNYRAICKAALRILLKCVSFPRINMWQDQAMQRYNKSCNNFVVSMASRYSYGKQLMPYSVYGKPGELFFTDGMYYVPQEYETHLKKIYGDYMKLPPESERDALIDYVREIKYCKNVDELLAAQENTKNKNV